MWDVDAGVCAIVSVCVCQWVNGMLTSEGISISAGMSYKLPYVLSHNVNFYIIC